MADLVRRLSSYVHGVETLDSVGKAYLIVAGLWTLFVFTGLTLLVFYRHLNFIRMRKPIVLVLAVLSIHLYLVLVMMGYPFLGMWPCQMAWWFMGIWFPLGIALFHVHNVQLLSISYQQKKLLYRPAPSCEQPTAICRNMYNISTWWRGKNLLARTCAFTGLGLCIQLIVTLVIFFGSRKFHPSWGLFSHAYPPAQCGAGWEWFPTIVWQILWTYGFGPYILFKIRKINDVHRWKLQTYLAIFASIPGSILWLASSYSPAFDSVTQYWSPSMWFIPGLMTMEFIMIFFPLLEVYTSSESRRTALSAIKDWEARSHGRSTVSMSTTVQGSVEVTCSSSIAEEKSQDKRSGLSHNMRALEKALQSHHEELLEYAATREFTAENIIFLRRTRDFKELCESTFAKECERLSPEAHHQLFHEAKNIYHSCVSIYTAQFPVNIESRVYEELEAVFEEKPRHGLTNIITPFVVGQTGQYKGGGAVGRDSGDSSSTRKSPNSTSTPLTKTTFDKNVFDRAEQSVKYMVLTNTWSRYCYDLETGDWTSSLRSVS